jgi:hypothetical protein
LHKNILNDLFRLVRVEQDAHRGGKKHTGDLFVELGQRWPVLARDASQQLRLLFLCRLSVEHSVAASAPARGRWRICTTQLASPAGLLPIPKFTASFHIHP